MPIPRSFLRLLPLGLTAVSLFSLGCHAQPAGSQVGKNLPLEQARRVEVLLRQKAQLPPGSTISVGPRQASELPGYDKIAVFFTSPEGKSSHPIDFLISADGKTIAQFNKYDISADPRNLISAEGRPARGGPANAPVVIVGFDDLECPYCAKLHETIFPAITARYGDSVRVVYKDFPLDQHPWAMHAAVDVNCLGTQSVPGYWNLVDYIHAHADEIGVPEGDGPKDKTLPRAIDQLDKLTKQQGQFQKVDGTKLDACMAKQDATAINASREVATALNVDSTPSLFINGDKIDGALPLDFLFKVVDDALRAEGKTPPPPYVAPPVAVPAAPAGVAPAAPAAAGKPAAAPAAK